MAAPGLSAPGHLGTPRSRQSGAEDDDVERGDAMKGSQKPKKSAKKPAQKTLKERRVEKRAGAKQGRQTDA